MDLGLADRHVVIFGGSRGIGLACTKTFLAEGARVAIVARDPDGLTRALAELRGTGAVGASAYRCDAGQPDEVRDTMQRIVAAGGPIDVLVNCAGSAHRNAPEDLDAAAYRQAIEAKYLTYVNAIDAVVHAMGQRGRGAIVNVAGTSGKVASALHVAAGGANAAVMLITVALAKAYASKGVRINAVNPGVTMTDRLGERLRLAARETGGSEQEALDALLDGIPMKRAAEPADIARAVAFLASDAASYITGAVVPVDGGQSAVI